MSRGSVLEYTEAIKESSSDCEQMDLSFFIKPIYRAISFMVLHRIIASYCLAEPFSKAS